MSAPLSEIPPRNYFGRKWDAPAFEGAVEVPVPVGRECMLCHEQVTDGDSGTLEWVIESSENASYRPVHIECFLRMMLGSPAHLTGECSCTTGAHHDDDDRPWREQARETMQILIQERGGRP